MFQNIAFCACYLRKVPVNIIAPFYVKLAISIYLFLELCKLKAQWVKATLLGLCRAGHSGFEP